MFYYCSTKELFPKESDNSSSFNKEQNVQVLQDRQLHWFSLGILDWVLFGLLPHSKTFPRSSNGTTSNTSSPTPKSSWVSSFWRKIMKILNFSGLSPRMDWPRWFSQWQVAPQILQPEHRLYQSVAWCYHSLLETFPLPKFLKALKSYLDLGWFIAAKEPVLSISGERWGAGVDHEASGNVEKQGRGGLTGRWTSSSCPPGRSRSYHSPIVGLHPCHLADPTISGYPAQMTLHEKGMSHLGVDVVSHMSTWRPVKLPVVTALTF